MESARREVEGGGTGPDQAPVLSSAAAQQAREKHVLVSYSTAPSPICHSPASVATTSTAAGENGSTGGDSPCAAIVAGT
jgi:hypothetical protein